VKALTLWQPMCHALVHLGKSIENRPMHPPANLLGQLFAVHAGKTWDKDHAQQVAYVTGTYLQPDHVIYSAIIGVARLVRVVHVDDMVDMLRRADPALQSPWFSGPFGLVVSEQRPLREPVPARGMQGFWPLPPEIEAAVMAQLAPTTEEHHG
jgi:hypothetical protein